MKLFISIFFYLFINILFSQKPSDFFNIKSVNETPVNGTFLANPESRVKLIINNKKIIDCKNISLGDNLSDRYTLYFKSKRDEFKAVFFANIIKIYKNIYNKYKLIYEIETYETNSFFVN